MQDREVHDVPVGAIAAQQRNTVAFADAESGEAASEAGDAARDLRGPQAPLAAGPRVDEDRGRLRRPPLREEIKQRAWFAHRRPPESRSRPPKSKRRIATLLPSLAPLRRPPPKGSLPR